MNMFTSIPLQKVKKSKFNHSHSVKGSAEPGYLVPVLCKDVLPGDSWDMDSQMMLRVVPLVSPMYHDVDVKLYSFYIPWRLVWTEFKDYITKGRLGTANPVHPFVTITDATKAHFEPGKLADYLGIQTVVDPVDGTIQTPITNEVPVSVLHARAYQETWNEYFLNDNLQAPNDFSKGSGDSLDDIDVLFTLRKRQWEADRYVSALPFAQRGATVIMPVDIEFDYKSVNDAQVYDGLGNPSGNAGPLQIFAGTPPPASGGLTDDVGSPVRIENIESIEGTSLDINEFREALALQKWLENNARGGGKYIDQLLVRWGVRSSDARLQRPEFLGGASAPLVVSEVLSTVQFTDGSDNLPQGNMAGHGIAVGSGNGFRRFFEEHGCVITLMCIVPRTGYMQGIPKQFTRFDSLEWANPEFAHLGEEPIKRGELFYDPVGVAGANDVVFGYTPRFSDLKFSPSTVHGELRTFNKHWTMAREFDSAPLLNTEFVECTPTTRVYAVEDGTMHYFYYIKHRISMIRALPYYGVPGKMTV